MRVTVEWTSFDAAFVNSYTAETAAAYCSEVARAVADACATTPAVRREVKELTCRFGTPALRAKNGALDAAFDWEGFGLYDDSRQALHGIATKAVKSTVAKKKTPRAPKS